MSRYRMISILFVGAIASPSSIGQVTQTGSGSVSLTSFSQLIQDFNTLVSSGTGGAANLPIGWYFSEAGTNRNSTYTASAGSATGDTYSFGATSSTDRALGTLQSGSLIPTIGVQFTNNTGAIITSVDVEYYGELWRRGAVSRTDSLQFHYSLDGTDLANGTYTSFASLDYTSAAGAAVANNLGDTSANRTFVSSTISGLSIPNGSSFWFRWTDIDVSGADDGMGIDDFKITPIPEPATVLGLSAAGLLAARFARRRNRS